MYHFSVSLHILGIVPSSFSFFYIRFVINTTSLIVHVMNIDSCSEEKVQTTHFARDSFLT
jgi:hypothetical protein